MLVRGPGGRKKTFSQRFLKRKGTTSMKTFYKTSVALLLCSVSVGFSTQNAMATADNRVAAGLSGMADVASDSSCFGGAWNGVVNDCSTFKRWDVPITVDGAYGLSMSVSADLIISGEAANVHCQGQATSWDDTSVSKTGWVAAGGVSDTGARNPSLGTITVPFSNSQSTIPGTASVACFIGQNTVFVGVQY
jgi:hypothetical protein